MCTHQPRPHGGQPQKEHPPTFLSGVLTTIRKYTSQFTPVALIWAVFVSAALANVTIRLLFPGGEKLHLNDLLAQK